MQCILKRKREYLDAYEECANPTSKRPCRRGPESGLNELMWDWYQKVRSKNLPVSGPMLQQKALHYSKEMGNPDFKASNGWLESFKKRHNIGKTVLCGEASSVSDSVVRDWNSVLISHIDGYEPCDIYNMDETGLFYRALPDRSLTVKGQDCKGGKRSKERITVALCANMAGEMCKPLVIGKSAKPRCFRNLDI